MTKAAQKRIDQQIDRQIEEIFYRRCSGVQIDIMDIGKVFHAGRQALAAGLGGLDLEAAIVARVAELRRN